MPTRETLGCALLNPAYEALVSGLLTFFGSSGEIVRMLSAGKLVLEHDSRILAEYREVLHRETSGTPVTSGLNIG